jgi:hypothetical protein
MLDSTRELALFAIARRLDRPSVYMGGPSQRALRLATSVLEALDMAGLYIVEGGIAHGPSDPPTREELFNDG